MKLISRIPIESPYSLVDIQRERASRSLYSYLKQSWPTMEPGYQFKDNWHIGAICEHLQAVSDGQIKRLIVNIPPRHCKSSIISVAWPTWDWIANPHRQFLFASYAAALSIRDAVKSRRLINSPWYQEHFGKVFSLSDDQNQKTRYSNDKNGYRVATSVGGQLTGDGADFVCCVPKGSVVYSCNGNREMSRLVSSKERVRVLGYDHVNGVPRWQEIEEYEANPTRRIITVRTRTRSVRCTEDHPVFVIGRGYVPASLIEQGDMIIWAGMPDARGSEFTCDMGVEVVESVTPDGVIEPTFNIRVSPDHNYFANGILVHNCDDPNSATDAESEAIRESTLEWWDQVIPTRLNDPKEGAFVVIQQRLHTADITGHILAKELGWDHLVFPARYERSPIHHVKSSLGFKDPRTKEGELLWPDHFGEKEISTLEQRLGAYGTSGQLQQRPAPAGGGLIKRDHFKLWPAEKGLPHCSFIVQSYDTAFTEKTSGDPTACTTWGVFKPVVNPANKDPAPWCVIMLDGWSEHLAYPDLRRKAINEYNTEYGDPPRIPDVVLIEDKGSGQALKVDMARAGVPVRTYNPHKADKTARVHIVLPLLESGRVYLPESAKRPGEPCSWCEPLLKECMFFPKAEHDDLVDTMTQCLIMLHDNSMLSIDAQSDDNDALSVERVNPYAM